MNTPWQCAQMDPWKIEEQKVVLGPSMEVDEEGRRSTVDTCCWSFFNFYTKRIITSTTFTLKNIYLPHHHRPLLDRLPRP
jgi:hypothetical protein